MSKRNKNNMENYKCNLIYCEQKGTDFGTHSPAGSGSQWKAVQRWKVHPIRGNRQWLVVGGGDEGWIMESARMRTSL